MTKRMLIDAAHEDETRVALLDHELVFDYDFISSAKTINKGNIYLAKITRVEPSLQAAFVEYGGGKQGFLPFSEIHADYYQLPAEDKQKLLEEQIAEAEAEEKAEEEAFEREQAARGSRRDMGDDEDEGDNFDAGDAESDYAQPDAELEQSSDALVAYHEAEAGDSADIASLPGIAPVEIPADFVNETPSHFSVEPLVAQDFATYGDALPEEVLSNASAENTEATNAEDHIEGGETTAEDGEEARSRNNRGGKAQSFHRRYRIQEVIKRNQIVLVQVIKEERGNKGCSLTTYISLAGRSAVLMPNSPKGGGISRKITDRETRRRLKDVAAEFRSHRGMSVIIRTAGLDRTKAEIRRDYEYLVKLWNEIRERTLAASAPALIYEEGNLVKRSLRDLYTSDVSEVIIEGDAAYADAKNFMRMLMPSHAGRIKQYKGQVPLFAYAGVEDQLAAMTEPQVKLPSGGYLVIHPTEALISIDVNSGRSTTERNVEETALKTNLEAAAEVGRQLRLRDLAGLIVIDFIDMNYGKNRKAVERAMKDSLKADRAKIQIGRISMFGLMELSRQRLRPSIAEAMGAMCPHCRGTGYIHSVETVGIQIVRTLEKEAASGEFKILRVTTYPEAALHLLNQKRELLQALEARFGVTVTVTMDNTIITGNFRLMKVTEEGKEILHEDSKAHTHNERSSRGRRGGRGRERGGREAKAGGPLRFDESMLIADTEEYVPEADGREALPDDDEIIGRPSEETQGARPPREPREPREPRDRNGRNSRNRGGRNRNRNGRDRDRTPREDKPTMVAFDEAGNPLPVTETHNEAATANTSAQLAAEGAEGDRGNRRRGRRGGRNRSRTPRERSKFEEGSIGNPVVAGDSAAGSEGFTSAPYQPSEAPAPRAAYVPREQKPSFVVPLSESQVNPPAAVPISSSSNEPDKPKKRGWWSKVLES